MKPTSRLILVENVIPEGASFHFGKWTDLEMLVVGGRERTETEYRALLTAAGFDLQEVVVTHSPLSLLVAKTSVARKQTQDVRPRLMSQSMRGRPGRRPGVIVGPGSGFLNLAYLSNSRDLKK
jgi:O-methyltransferase domain